MPADGDTRTELGMPYVYDGTDEVWRRATPLSLSEVESSALELSIGGDTRSVANASVVTFDAMFPNHDPNGWISSGRMFAPDDGVYLVVAMFDWSSNMGSATRILHRIRRGGTAVGSWDGAPGYWKPSRTVTAVATFSAGQEITMMAYHNADSAQNISARLAATRLVRL
jgi:hypothetical protein